VATVTGESAEHADKPGSNAPRTAAPHDDESARLLDHDDARLQLNAASRDEAADDRDTAADERDEDADARDTHAEVRDEAVSDQPDVTGTRRFAAQDRSASSQDRGASADDRLEARADRKASSWDRIVAERIREQLIASLDDADKMPDVTLIIGQAQGMLMATFGGNAAEAMMEIGDRADRDEVGLQEAARRLLADGASSGPSGIRRPASEAAGSHPE
jgi:hypothetical protein